MRIAENTGDRLVLTHGSPVLLGTFAALTVVLAYGLWFLASRLGFANEPVAYTTLAVAVCAWGTVVTRLTRFTFDGREQVLKWRRRGVLPASGTVPFDRIEQAALEVRPDRKGTPYYRVLIAIGGGRALALTPGRTRDVFACLEVIEAVSGMLGHPRVTDLVAEGKTAEGIRLAENRYGIPRDRVEAWLERRNRHAGGNGPACTA
jgi:hypothetical protein